jgi:ABC-2 type transport system ATP-binding protein
MWDELARLAAQENLTVLLTTHYLEEADHLAERVAIVSRGKVVVEGGPDVLKSELEGDAVIVELTDGRHDDGEAAVRALTGVCEATTDGTVVRARVPNGGRAVPGILAALDEQRIPVASVTVSRPSLDDVYLHYTGREFRSDDAADAEAQEAA